MATTLPNEKPGNMIAVGIPSKNGLLSIRVALSLAELSTSINCSLMRIVVEKKPVDEARNQIVEMAKQADAKYLLFMDDDNLLPPFTIPRLLNLKAKVASGVYYTKFQPPTPVILKKNYPGGYDKWTYGDVIEVDYIGLGCALIDMSIFDEIEKPYFKYNKGSIDPFKGEPHIGEDVYFCDKVTSKGHKIVVDTYVQAGHEDFASGTTYFFLQEGHCGAWQGPDGLIQYLPNAESRLKTVVNPEAVSSPKLCWGWGDHDDFKEVNCVDVAEIRKRYKDVEHIKIRNVLEYRSPEETVSLLHAILSVAKVGTNVEIRVPDSIPRIRALAGETDEDFIDKFTGTPKGRYRSFMTKANVEAIAKLLNIQETTVLVEGDEIVLKGKV